MRTALVLAAALTGVAALTDAEIALFSARSCSVTYGAASGATLTASISVSKDTGAGTVRIVTNGIPDHATCDPATTSAGGTCYDAPLTTYFSNQGVDTTVPLIPTVAASTTSLPAATIGYARNGVAIFSAYSKPCTDAVTDEAIGFDKCQGHPQEQGAYHYHAAGSCLDGYLTAWNAQQEYFIGVAIDGFPIYSMYDASGNLVTNSQLDDCHGYDPGSGYRYIANLEFPYMVGCFKGTPLSSVSPHCGRRKLAAAAASDSSSSTTANALNASLHAAHRQHPAKVTVGDRRQLASLCSSTDNSACAGSSCGFPCGSDCSLWSDGDDATTTTTTDDVTGAVVGMTTAVLAVVIVVPTLVCCLLVGICVYCCLKQKKAVSSAV